MTLRSASISTDNSSTSYRPTQHKHASGSIEVTGSSRKLLSREGDPKSRSKVVECDPREVGMAAHPGEIPRQRPYAVVVGCSDARAGGVPLSEE